MRNWIGYLDVILISKFSQSLQLSSFWKFWQLHNLRLLFHLPVRLSVSLSVSNITGNTLRDLLEIVRRDQTWYNEYSGTFGDVMFNPLDTGNFVLFFFCGGGGNSCLLATLTKHRQTDFHGIFRTRIQKDIQRTPLFHDLTLNYG